MAQTVSEEEKKDRQPHALTALGDAWQWENKGPCLVVTLNTQGNKSYWLCLENVLINYYQRTPVF